MKFFAYLVFAILLLPLPSAAANQFVKCVQEQLIALGQNPGPVDGALGKRTRGALAKAVGDIPEVANLPKLTNRYAVTWCRELGKTKYGLKAFYPSTDVPLVIADDETGSYQRASLLTLYNGVRAFYAKEHDIHLASRVDIAAAASPKVLAQRLRKLQADKRHTRSSTKSIMARCDTSEPVTAFADQHFIAVCFAGQTDFGFEWFRKKEFLLSYMLAHEYFHAIQYEYAAAKQPIRYLKSKGPPPPLLRPSWMTEGSADYFANLYIKHKTGRALPISAIFSFSNAHKRTLKQISKVRNLRDGRDYQVSQLAVHLLGERFGKDALIQYWQDIGMGVAHAAAFEKNFEMTVRAYEKLFETLRNDLGAATEFAKPKT